MLKLAQLVQLFLSGWVLVATFGVVYPMSLVGNHLQFSL